MIYVHYASLASRRVQHRVFYLDGHQSRYQPRLTALKFGEQTATSVFPLVIAVPVLRSNHALGYMEKHKAQREQRPHSQALEQEKKRDSGGFSLFKSFLARFKYHFLVNSQLQLLHF